MTARGPGQRAGLTRSAVLEAARDALAEGGVASLTMRALARRLGVAPNALYSHVPSRIALLDQLLDEVLADVAAPDADTADPVVGLVALMTSTYRVLTAQADLVPLYLSRQGARGPNAVRLGRVVDALLARAGVAEEDVAEARRVLIIHAIGSAAFATTAEQEQDAPPVLAARDLEHTFTRSLDWLVDGVTGAGAQPRSGRRGSGRRP